MPETSNQNDELQKEMRQFERERTRTLVDIEMDADSDFDMLEKVEEFDQEHNFEQIRLTKIGSLERDESLQKYEEEKNVEDLPFEGLEKDSSTFIDHSNFSYFYPLGHELEMNKRRMTA